MSSLKLIASRAPRTTGSSTPLPSQHVAHAASCTADVTAGTALSTHQRLQQSDVPVTAVAAVPAKRNVDDDPHRTQGQLAAKRRHVGGPPGQPPPAVSATSQCVIDLCEDIDAQDQDANKNSQCRETSVGKSAAGLQDTSSALQAALQAAAAAGAAADAFPASASVTATATVTATSAANPASPVVVGVAGGSNGTARGWLQCEGPSAMTQIEDAERRLLVEKAMAAVLNRGDVNWVHSNAVSLALQLTGVSALFCCL